jgi:hypothetical protein
MISCDHLYISGTGCNIIKHSFTLTGHKLGYCDGAYVSTLISLHHSKNPATNPTLPKNLKSLFPDNKD